MEEKKGIKKVRKIKNEGRWEHMAVLTGRVVLSEKMRFE